MTGYARVDGSIVIERLNQTWSWNWELKSVNARGLDLRFRTPPGSEAVETIARKTISGSLARGSITANLYVRCGAEAVVPRINRTLLRDIISLQAELEAQGLTFASPPRLDVLLTIRGIIDAEEADPLGGEERTQLDAAVLIGLQTALDKLREMRVEEGIRLGEVLSEHITMIADLHDHARAQAEGQTETIKNRLRRQTDELLLASPGLTEERLAQELAILATKSDVREEIARLKAHVEACRDLLDSGGAVGRRLDFLCQELNREANTICSKASDLALTKIGLELKSTIEQFREQIQNVE
ncbi:MAG: YicC family protein [Rhodospirillaceae bacterium]|nr:YicC family protein [Rhodospirillaceae bacterium]